MELKSDLDRAVGSVIEQFLHAALEGNPISFSRLNERNVRRAGAAIRRAGSHNDAHLNQPIVCNEFLAACSDLTADEACEHLLVGYGSRFGSTTMIDKIGHVVGRERSVAISTELCQRIRAHHARQSNGEVIVFHNHPRTGTEPEWFYLLKGLIRDFPVPSAADRNLLQTYSFTQLGLLRHLLGEGRILFYLGESGFVRQIKLPNLPLRDAR